MLHPSETIDLCHLFGQCTKVLTTYTLVEHPMLLPRKKDTSSVCLERESAAERSLSATVLQHVWWVWSPCLSVAFRLISQSIIGTPQK